jgi:protein gp37
MARESKIEWTDATFNPWIGCERVAPECDNCYAAARSKRVGEPELWEGHRRRTSEVYWRGPLKWARTLPAELGRRPRVFCASLADVFDNRAKPEWLADLFALIRATPELDWLLLTKRITRAAHCLERVPPFPNVWLGVSAGTREAYERDVPRLLAIPGPVVRFVSMEPLLEDVGRLDYATRSTSERVYVDNPLTGFRSNGQGGDFGRRVDWVIAGGESGPGARPMHPDWPRAIRAQCAEHRVPFFFKQWGEWAPYDSERDVGVADSPKAVAGNYGRKFRHLTPAGLDVRDGASCTATVVRIGKKAAGRLLDGRVHDEVPSPPTVRAATQGAAYGAMCEAADLAEGQP